LNNEYQNLWDALDIQSLMDIHDLSGKGILVSASSTSKVWKQMLSTTSIYLKQYFYPHSWSFFLRQSRARSEWNSYVFFQTIGIACPPVLCCAEQRHFGRLIWAIIITQEIPNTQNLYNLFQSNLLPTQRLDIIYELADQLGSLHTQHFSHRDFKLRNILWQSTGLPGHALYWIDCPRGHRPLYFSQHDIVKDLTDLYAHASFLWQPLEWKEFIEKYSAIMQISSIHLQKAIMHRYQKKHVH